MTRLINKLQLSVLPPLMFVAMLWLIMIVLVAFSININQYGVLPRTLFGLRGILTAPLVHSDFLHLMSNSFSLLVMGTMVFYFYPKPSVKALAIIYFFSGLGVWLIGRNAFHIGASGISYGLAAFLIFSGLFRKDIGSLAIALLVVFAYGGMVWGLLPLDTGISWEAHLSGAAMGALTAVYYRNVDPPERPTWENEDDDDERYKSLNYKSAYQDEVFTPPPAQPEPEKEEDKN